MTNNREKWFVVSETHVPGLVAYREVALLHGGDGWGEIHGPVFSITEHMHQLDEAGVIGKLLDIRTRLVVRAVRDDSPNGHALGFEPLDASQSSYRKFSFQERD